MKLRGDMCGSGYYIPEPVLGTRRSGEGERKSGGPRIIPQTDVYLIGYNYYIYSSMYIIA